MLRNFSSRLWFYSGLRTQDSALLRAAAIFYLVHVLFHAKIALLEISAFGSLLFLSWAIARRETRFSFHILYYPLFLYGVVSTISSIASGRSIHGDLELTLWFKMLIFPVAVILLREVPAMRKPVLYAHAVLGGGMAIW